MAVTLHLEKPFTLPNPVALKSLIRRVVRGEGKLLKAPINLVLGDDALVRQLNREHRGLDKVTDVLSFHYGESDLLGEIYVALPQTQRQAPRWKNSFENELNRVVVHGLLHLAGYDHHAPGERAIMRAREDHYLQTPEKKPLKSAKKRTSPR
jgi:probable rRNA maturation factor